MELERAEYEDRSRWGDREPIARTWIATAYGVSVTYTTSDLELVLYADPISTMREVGIALVDETRTMRANQRRDRKGNE